MRTNIYYFSGTGNALALAKQLKSALGADAKIISITDFKNGGGTEADADTVGFVFPVYFLSIPVIVKQFIQKLGIITPKSLTAFRGPRIKGGPYIFAAAACNSVPGHSFFTINRLLKKKGYNLSAGYSVVMPGVSVVNGYLTPRDVNLQRIEDSKAKIIEIAAAVNKREANKFDGENSIKTRVGSRFMTLAADKMMSPKLFYTTDKCLGCGTCAKVCPAGNISMSAAGPVWGGDCMHCMACLHWCPEGAAELGKHSPGKARFRHPDVTQEEMFRG